MRLATILISLGIALSGCTSSQFAGGTNVGGGKPKKNESSGGSPKKEDDLGNPDEDDESDPAEDPVMVSGAFLYCETDYELPQTEATATAGCVVKNVDGNKFDFTGIEIKWILLDLFNSELPSTFVDLPADQPRHVTVVVPKAGLELLRVKLKLKKGKSQGEYVVPIVDKGGSGDKINAQPEEGGPNIKDFGKNGDYQLGDDSYVNQGQYCSAQLQQIALSGASLTFTITVKTDTKLAISMGHICGVNRAENTVKVRDGSPTPLHEGIIPTNSRDVALPPLELKAGTYTLELYSPKYAGGSPEVPQGDRDDFVIGDFRFVSDGEIEIADPVADQVVEQ